MGKKSWLQKRIDDIRGKKDNPPVSSAPAATPTRYRRPATPATPITTVQPASGDTQQRDQKDLLLETKETELKAAREREQDANNRVEQKEAALQATQQQVAQVTAELQNTQQALQQATEDNQAIEGVVQEYQELGRLTADQLLPKSLRIVQEEQKPFGFETKEEKQLALTSQELSTRQISLINNLGSARLLYRTMLWQSMILRLSSVTKQLRKAKQHELADQIDETSERIEEIGTLPENEQLELLRSDNILRLLMANEEDTHTPIQDQKDDHRFAVTLTADMKPTLPTSAAVTSTAANDSKDAKDVKHINTPVTSTESKTESKDESKKVAATPVASVRSSLLSVGAASVATSMQNGGFLFATNASAGSVSPSNVTSTAAANTSSAGTSTTAVDAKSESSTSENDWNVVTKEYAEKARKEHEEQQMLRSSLQLN